LKNSFNETLLDVECLWLWHWDSFRGYSGT